MATVEVTQHDVGVIFADNVDADDLSEHDMNDVTEVLFLMRKIGDDDLIVVGTGLVVDAATREIGYSSQEEDLHTAGYFYQAWQLTFTTGEVYTFRPDDGGYNIVHVLADLGP